MAMKNFSAPFPHGMDRGRTWAGGQDRVRQAGRQADRQSVRRLWWMLFSKILSALLTQSAVHDPTFSFTYPSTALILLRLSVTSSLKFVDRSIAIYLSRLFVANS